MDYLYQMNSALVLVLAAIEPISGSPYKLAREDLTTTALSILGTMYARYAALPPSNRAAEYALIRQATARVRVHAGHAAVSFMQKNQGVSI